MVRCMPNANRAQYSPVRDTHPPSFGSIVDFKRRGEPRLCLSRWCIGVVSWLDCLMIRLKPHRQTVGWGKIMTSATIRFPLSRA